MPPGVSRVGETSVIHSSDCEKAIWRHSQLVFCERHRYFLGKSGKMGGSCAVCRQEYKQRRSVKGFERSGESLMDSMLFSVQILQPKNSIPSLYVLIVFLLPRKIYLSERTVNKRKCCEPLDHDLPPKVSKELELTMTIYLHVRLRVK